ncbi:MAG: hypothetical protein WDA60_04630 [Acidimicrobiia bacterium]|jgi:hypothetical protein
METNERTERVDLAAVWGQFCGLLNEAGDVITRDGRPDDPLDRAEGFRMLTRLMRGALETYLEHSDPSHPDLVCTCHETIKIVAENPDNLYLGAALDGSREYRVWGTRGDARWISFNTFAGGGFGGGGAGTGTTLHEHQMAFGPDGAFEVILSGREHPGTTWLPIVPDTKSLTIRQTFARKGIDRPAEIHIEVLDGDAAPPPPLREETVARALLTTGHYIRAVAEMGASWADRSARNPNVWIDAQDDDTRAFKDPQITYHQAYFDLVPDEALVVEFTPPPCDYWMIALHNHWMETLDYTHHTITLNNHTAEVEPDGSVRCVIAPRDPGVPNWLDTAGHLRGLVGVRWVGDDVPDVLPTSRLVLLGD